MPAPRKYPNELRERSVRLVAEAREQEPSVSINAAVRRVAPRVGVNPDTLRGWCKRAAIDAGPAPGTRSSDNKRIRELEHEVKELFVAVSRGYARGTRDAAPDTLPRDRSQGLV